MNQVLEMQGKCTIEERDDSLKDRMYKGGDKDETYCAMMRIILANKAWSIAALNITKNLIKLTLTQSLQHATWLVN